MVEVLFIPLRNKVFDLHFKINKLYKESCLKSNHFVKSPGQGGPILRNRRKYKFGNTLEPKAGAYMKKFIAKLTLFLLPFTIIPILNYNIDSAYLLGRRSRLDLVAELLLSGKTIAGLEIYDDRVLNKLIINKMDKVPEVIVLGTSQTMTLRASYLGLLPGDYFNHSLAAGTISDMIAILGCYKIRGALPKKIIIGASPTLFDQEFNERLAVFSERWKALAPEYYYLLNLIENDTSSFGDYGSAQYHSDQFKNLFSFNYAIRNLKSFQRISSEKNLFRIAKDTSVNDLLVTFDGSIYYPHAIRCQHDTITLNKTKTFIYNQFTRKRNKLNNKTITDKDLFIKLVDYILSCESQIIFFLPPLHPLAYKEISTKSYLRVYREIEELLKNIAKTRNIPLFGSYDPNLYGLESRDFYDAIHLQDFAMKKIFNPDQKNTDDDENGDICKSLGIESHYLEAEHADSIGNPLEVTNDENASNGKYIYSPNGTGNHYKPGSIMAAYKINIEQAGEYILWGLVNAADKKDNSFFVQIDDELDNVWEIDTGSKWHWDQVNNRNKTDLAIFILNKGEHTIKIKLREDGTKLDKILLTNDLDFVPKGKGDIAENIM